jgi:hypothetical protein
MGGGDSGASRNSSSGSVGGNCGPAISCVNIGGAVTDGAAAGGGNKLSKSKEAGGGSVWELGFGALTLAGSEFATDGITDVGPASTGGSAGMVKATLQFGQRTFLPASSSGTFSFLLQPGHRNTRGMASQNGSRRES